MSKGRPKRIHIFQTGDIVIFKYSQENTKLHKLYPYWYPKVNTIGKVISMRIEDNITKLYIKWEDDSTSKNDCWYITPEQIRVLQYCHSKRKNINIFDLNL